MGSSSLLLSPSFSSIASNATASASLSALPLPVSSWSSSDLILDPHQLEHQEAAAVDLVKRPAPDLYMPPPPWHVTGDFFDVTAPTGGSAVLLLMLSLPVEGPAEQRRRQIDEVMLTFPLQCAESVSSDDLDEPQHALQEIAELATPFCASTHRIAAYFAEAMPARLVSYCNGICLYAPLPHASYPAAPRLVNSRSRTATAFQAFDAISRSKKAIQEGFEREDLVHILQIMITQGLEWPGLINILASRPHGPPRVRLTMLGASMEALNATRKRPSDFTNLLVLSFEFCAMAYKAGNLDREKLGVGTRLREAIAVHWLPHSFYDIMISKTPCLIERYKINDQRETKNGMKWALQKQDGGEEEISQRNPGLNKTPLGCIKYSNTYTPGCIQERHKDKTICDLDDKGEYEPPKVTGIRNHTRCLLLLVLFCTLITAVDSSSRSESSQQGFCPKPDVILFLLPPHETVCPVLDISSVHWTHSKRTAPQDPQQWATASICATFAFLFPIFCLLGPWFSINALVPVEGKVHNFFFIISVKPLRMWYCTLALSVNYYVSMIAHGIMLKSDQSCGIWGSNAIYCFVFLLFIIYLCYHEKMTFQVNNKAYIWTCCCYVAGVLLIGLLHFLCAILRPTKFDQIFYFEKIAFTCMVLMYLFRVCTMEHTAFNYIVNIMALP